MKNTYNLLLTQTTLIITGTVFAWYIVYTDFVAFFGTYDSLLIFTNCTPPNPFTQACFYGAFAFLFAGIWSLRVFRGKTKNQQKSQRHLLYFLIASCVFAWSSFSYMLYSFQTASKNPFTCVLTPDASPFTTPCFIGAVFFTLSLLASVAAYLAIKKNLRQ